MEISEKSKMIKGQLYNANDPDLVEDRDRCKINCYEYNHLHPSKRNEKQILLKQLFRKCTSNITIEPNFWCDYGYNIEIGDNFYANHNLIILDGAKVSIGNNVFIGPNCAIYTAGHPTDISLRNQGLEYAYPISIGNNVWIGGGVTILPGINIGDNITIGAGSIVTTDIPSNSIAVGNPCKVIKNNLQ